MNNSFQMPYDYETRANSIQIFSLTKNFNFLTIVEQVQIYHKVRLI